jgi:hypothetical protein
MPRQPETWRVILARTSPLVNALSELAHGPTKRAYLSLLRAADRSLNARAYLPFFISLEGELGGLPPRVLGEA